MGGFATRYSTRLIWQVAGQLPSPLGDPTVTAYPNNFDDEVQPTEGLSTQSDSQ